MKNKVLLKKFTMNVKDCFIGGSLRDLEASIHVYKVHHSFLWWKWTTFETKMFIPYVTQPFYDGEYNTNKILDSVSEMLKSKVDEYISTKENS